jgi:hypothetical protein
MLRLLASTKVGEGAMALNLHATALRTGKTTGAVVSCRKVVLWTNLHITEWTDRCHMLMLMDDFMFIRKLTNVHRYHYRIGKISTSNSEITGMKRLFTSSLLDEVLHLEY